MTDLYSIVGESLVPSKNSTDDVRTSDVVGNKLDDEYGNSIYSQNFISEKHQHSVQYCIPSLAAGITITSAAGAWNLSAAYTVVIATNAIQLPFDIHMVHVGTFTASEVYQLELYSGADGAEVLISQVRFNRTTNTNPGSILPCITPLLPANTQVKAKLASSGGGASVNFSVMYHTY